MSECEHDWSEYTGGRVLCGSCGLGVEEMVERLRHDVEVLRAEVKAAEDLLLAERRKTEAAEARIAELEGLRPELPYPPFLGAPMPEGMPRYGLRYNGPTEPLAVPMPDGYWTPWHVANARAEAAEADAKLAAVREAAQGLRVALAEALDSDAAKTELSYLRKGIGTATKNAVWLRAEAAIATFDRETA